MRLNNNGVDQPVMSAPRLPVHHVMDPVWQRVPFPFAPELTVRRLGGVEQVTMARTYWGKALMRVHCYRVGDTLIDTGLSCLSKQLTDYVKQVGVRQAMVTHHHEDHAGNAAALRQAGVRVVASPQTAMLLSYDYPIPFYEHLVWGRSYPAAVSPLAVGDAEIEVGSRRGVVIFAPGHCSDQVAYFVPDEGWLFSGDAFLHENVRLFRRDENFWDTLTTMDRFLRLDFDALWCGHRPRSTGGKQAITQKRDWLLSLAEKTSHFSKQGLEIGEISRRLALGSNGLMWLSAGDASGKNLVRAILSGPRLRPEHCGMVHVHAHGGV